MFSPLVSYPAFTVTPNLVLSIPILRSNFPFPLLSSFSPLIPNLSASVNLTFALLFISATFPSSFSYAPDSPTDNWVFTAKGCTYFNSNPTLGFTEK